MLIGNFNYQILIQFPVNLKSFAKKTVFIKVRLCLCQQISTIHATVSAKEFISCVLLDVFFKYYMLHSQILQY